MRDVSHLNPDAAMPPRMHKQLDERAVTDLPWMRRERADANIRRAITDLRALAVEDVEFTRAYWAMAHAFEAALGLIDAIETYPSPFSGHSVKVVL